MTGKIIRNQGDGGSLVQFHENNRKLSSIINMFSSYLDNKINVGSRILLKNFKGRIKIFLLESETFVYYK